MTPLPTNPLGDSGLEITRVGFGAWALGGGGWAFSWGDQDDAASVAAIRHAIESGINWIDTAAVYGLGHSEEIVAAALSGIPEADRPYLFTKCGLVWDDADRTKSARRVGAAASIRAELEASLARLGQERVDLYQMHWPPDDGTPLEEYWQTLLDLVAEGKIGAAALSNHDVGQLERAEALGHVSAVQPPFSPINRSAAADVLPWCAGHRTGAIVYSPMQSGLLSGAFSAERAAALGTGDWRSRNAEFSGERLTANLALAEVLGGIGERHGTGAGSVAIAWTLAFAGVSGAIVGARSPAQVDGWLTASSLELSTEELDEIARAIERTGAGSGPTRP